MDAESRRRRRESSISLREQRWSMSSQRLEQIVAELMKPVGHYGQSFDRDDSGLLEEYLTGAGLRALQAVEEGLEPPPPNYAEMGLVIQSFAYNYSKKVDHLSRLVNSFNHTLDSTNVRNSNSPEVEAEAEAGAGAGAGGRRRRASTGAGGGFSSIALAASAAARRGAAPAGPPPTLPRLYAELQPRAPAPERALHDYAGEPIGALDEFRVAWRLHNGFLVEELESSPDAAVASGECDVRAMSLMELQEACARGAAPPPPPPPRAPPAEPPAPPEPMLPPPAALRRKRRSDVRVDDLIPGSFDLNISASVRRRLSARVDYSVDERWIRRVVRHRRDVILRARRDPPPPIQGFQGWSAAEARAAAATAGAAARAQLAGSPDASPLPEPDWAMQAGWAGLEAAGAAASKPLDLAALARDVRAVLPAPPLAITWQALAAAAAPTQPLPRVLLDVLMKASLGEVAIDQGAPLSVGQFSVRRLDDAPPAQLSAEDWIALTGAPPPASFQSPLTPPPSSPQSSPLLGSSAPPPDDP